MYTFGLQKAWLFQLSEADEAEPSRSAEQEPLALEVLWKLLNNLCRLQLQDSFTLFSLVSLPAIHPFLCFTHTHSSLYPILDSSLFPTFFLFTLHLWALPDACKHGNVHYLLLFFLLFFLYPPSAHRLFLTSCLVSTSVLLLIILDKLWKNINKHHHLKTCLSLLLSC